MRRDVEQAVRQPGGNGRAAAPAPERATPAPSPGSAPQAKPVPPVSEDRRQVDGERGRRAHPDVEAARDHRAASR